MKCLLLITAILITFNTSAYAINDPEKGVYDNEEDFNKALRRSPRKPYSETIQNKQELEKKSQEVLSLFKEYMVEQLVEDKENSPNYEEYKLSDEEKKLLNK